MSRCQKNIEEILRSRALKLAHSTEASEPEELLEVVEFQLAEERYAIELKYIREVMPLTELTPLPGTPDFVAGIINLRGEIISVINLKIFFKLSNTSLSDLNKVIILANQSMEFGILTDVIIGAQALAIANMQQSLPTLNGIHTKYLQGITSQRVILLDGGKILNDPDIVVYEDNQ